MVFKNFRYISLMENFCFKKYLENDYQMSHRPPESDFGAPLHDLTKIYPKDVYESPHYYAGDDFERESAYLALRYKDKPTRLVWIFRAVPKGVKIINPGDWVTINRKYAIQHSKHPFGECAHPLKGVGF